MRVEDVRVAADLAAPHEVDHPGEALSLVDGVGDHSLETCARQDRVDRRPIRDAVRAGVVAIVEDDVFGPELSLEAELARGVLRDPGHLFVRLLRPGGAVYSDY